MFQLYQIQWNDQKKIEILHLQIYSGNGSFFKKNVSCVFFDVRSVLEVVLAFIF